MILSSIANQSHLSIHDWIACWETGSSILDNIST